MLIQRTFQLLLIFLCLSTFLIAQERITEHITQGSSNSDTYIHKFEDIVYLIRITQCDEIKVSVVNNPLEIQELHSIQIKDAFGSQTQNHLFNEEYFCFATKQGIIAYNFLENIYSVTPYPEDWKFSSMQKMSKHTFFLALKNVEKRNFIRAIYDLNSGVILLQDDNYTAKVFSDYIIEFIVNSDGTTSYFGVSYPSFERDTLLRSVTSRREFVEDEAGLLYFLNEDGNLKSWDRLTKEENIYNSIQLGLDRAYDLALSDERILIGHHLTDNYEFEVFSTLNQSQLATKSIEIIHGFRISSVEIQGELVIAHTRSGGHFYSIVADSLIHLSSYGIDWDEKTYRLSPGRTLLQIDQGNHFRIIDHRDLTQKAFTGSIPQNMAVGSTLIEMDNEYLLLRRHDRGWIHNELIQIDTANMTVELNMAFNETNAGFHYDAELRFLQGDFLVTEEEVYRLRNLTEEELQLPPFEAVYNDDHFLFLQEDESALWLYDSTGLEKVICFEDHTELAGGRYSVDDFSVQGNYLFIAKGLDLFSYELSSGSLAIISDIRGTDFHEHGDWSYFITENSLYRVDQFLSLQRIESSVTSLRDFFSYDEELFFLQENSIYEIKEDGTVEERYSSLFRLSGNKFYSPDSSLFLLNGFNSKIYFDGFKFKEFSGGNLEYVADDFFSFGDSLYLVSDDVMIPSPLPVSEEYIIGAFTVYGLYFLVTKEGHSPYDVLRIYNSDIMYSQAELVWESLESSFVSGLLKIAKFEDNSLFIVGGQVFSIDEAGDIKHHSQLLSFGQSLIMEANTAYFMAYDKMFGHQVYKWSPEDPSSTELLISETESLKIYPNPVSDYVHLHSDKMQEWKLCDLNSRVVKSGTDSIIEVADFPSGTYIINMLIDGQWQAQTLVKF